MNTTDITFFLNHIKCFGGVFAADHFPFLQKKKLYIINTLKHSDTDVGHWVVLDYTGSKPLFIDSFGRPPTYYNFPPMKHSTRSIQHPDSDVCGLYCIYAVVSRCKKMTLKQMMKPFSANALKNDRFISKWFLKFNQ